MAGIISNTFDADADLLASELNDMYTRIVTTNDQSIGTPRSSSWDMDGNIIVLDVDGDTTVRADTDDIITFKLRTQDLFRIDGSVGTTVNGLTWAASATTVDVGVTAVGTDTDISVDLVPKGAGAFGTNGVETSIVSNMFFSF